MKRPNVDRPSTWKTYRNDMCKNCWGACCTMPVEIKSVDLVRLGVATNDEAAGSVKRLAKRLMKEGLIQSYRQGTEFFMLSQKSNNDCWFLDSKTRLCTVYEKRPDTCRQFPSIGPRPGFCPGASKI